MKILVCGSRHYQWKSMIFTVLTGMKELVDEVTVISGGAKGADSFAEEWTERFVGANHLSVYPADWASLGKSAGPRRNQQMLDEGKPDLVLAFHDDLENSKGTQDMIQRAVKAGVATYLIQKMNDREVEK